MLYSLVKCPLDDTRNTIQDNFLSSASTLVIGLWHYQAYHSDLRLILVTQYQYR